MIVKHGFVRDADGDWHCLDLFSRFATKANYENDRPAVNAYVDYSVVGFWKEDTEDDNPYEIDGRFESFHEAQCALDDAFGFTGD